MIIYHSKLTKLLWSGFDTVMLMGAVFTARPNGGLSDEELNHEQIHVWQWVETTVISLGFLFGVQLYLSFSFVWLLASVFSYYAIYALFWCLGKMTGLSKKISYRCNPFEMEAMMNQANLNYRWNRDLFAWINYIPKSWHELHQD